MADRSKNFVREQVKTSFPSGVETISYPNYFSDKFSQTSNTGDRKTPTVHEISCEQTTAFTGYRAEIYKPTGQIEEKISGNMGWVAPYFTFDLESIGPAVYNQAYGSCVEQLRGNLDLSVDVAQAGQTASMFRKLDSIVRHVSSFHPKHLFRSRNAFIEYLRRGKKKHARTAGSMWLEYQYGWKPLAGSIYDTASRLMSDDSFPLRVVGRGKDVRTSIHQWQPDPNTSRFTVPIEVVKSERCEMKLFFRTEPTALQKLAGYTSLNPASLLWETLPYSFVVDWVVDVGGYIRNRETQLVYNQLFSHGYVTKGSLTTAKCDQAGGAVSNGNLLYTYSIGGARSRSSWKRRDPVTSMPLPRLPSFDVKLGSGRLLNAAALLSQHLR